MLGNRFTNGFTGKEVSYSAISHRVRRKLRAARKRFTEMEDPPTLLQINNCISTSIKFYFIENCIFYWGSFFFENKNIYIIVESDI